MAYLGNVALDSAAKRFYEALRRHAGSIEELDVMGCHQGLWCFGHHNKALFSTFQNLTTLSVNVQEDIIVSSFGSVRVVGLTDVKIESPD